MTLPEGDKEARRRNKNRVVGIGLLVLVVLVFLTTIVRLGQQGG